MIITISGVPGSGKTTIGKKLAKELGYKFYSIGDLRGEMAKEKGMTINELNRLGENERWTDTKVDDYQKELGKTRDNLIIEGRLSFHFIPSSLKIFLTVDSHEGAKRIFNDPRIDEEKQEDIKKLEEQNKKRMKSDKKRYEKYYKVNPYDKDQYDIVVDSTKKTEEETYKEILTKIKEQAKHK